MDGIGDGFESGNGRKHAVPKANTNAYALQSLISTGHMCAPTSRTERSGSFYIVAYFS